MNSMSSTDYLHEIAGGDQFELAVEEVRQNVAAAKRRLRQEYPHFFTEEQR